MFSRKNTCENLAHYAVKASWDSLPAAAQHKLKDHLLDALGCALGALHAAPIQSLRAEQQPFSTGPCSLIAARLRHPRTRRSQPFLRKRD